MRSRKTSRVQAARHRRPFPRWFRANGVPGVCDACVVLAMCSSGGVGVGGGGGGQSGVSSI